MIWVLDIEEAGQASVSEVEIYNKQWKVNLSLLELPTIWNYRNTVEYHNWREIMRKKQAGKLV